MLQAKPRTEGYLSVNRASSGGSQAFNIGFRRRIIKGKACGLSVGVPSSPFRVPRSAFRGSGSVRHFDDGRAVAEVV